MLFKRFNPSKNLSHLVAYYWTLQSSDEDDNTKYRFVPDGYVDWIFHIGTPWQCDFPDDNQAHKTGRFHVFGQIKRHVDLNLAQGNLDLFGVKFNPWVVKKIWNIDMHYLTNSCLDIEHLDLPKINSLQHLVYDAKNNLERISLVEHFLESYANIKEDRSLKSALMSFSNDATNLDMSSYGFGVRRFEQRFKNEIGISAKLFYRTQRLNSVIGHLCTNERSSLTDVALSHNYYDQSHFIKDFKQFTGLSPSKFLKSINPNGDILNLRIPS